MCVESVKIQTPGKHSQGVGNFPGVLKIYLKGCIHLREDFPYLGRLRRVCEDLPYRYIEKYIYIYTHGVRWLHAPGDKGKQAPRITPQYFT